MNTTYEIQVFHVDRDAWLTDLREAVAAELLDVGLHRTVAVAVTESATVDGSPSVGVHLGSHAAAEDQTMNGRLADAMRAGLVVVPVVEQLTSFTGQTPPALRPFNGFAWTGDDPARRLARVLLGELGIEDKQRRVFISHKRDDGLWAAEQLHDALSHVGFKPFIDRFAIRSAAEVQDEIADALEDHAFLLLVETPLAHTSPWVFDEVDYALSHTMGTLILRWPGDVTPVPGSNNLPRLELDPDDLTTNNHNADVFTDAALDRVVEAVEAAHAHGLVRRRRMLVRSIEEAAAGAGECVPLPGWRLLVDHGGRSTLLGISPRLPTAEELQFLDLSRAEVGDVGETVLVHSARALREPRLRHLEWVTGDRDLELTPENAIGSRWL